MMVNVSVAKSFASEVFDFIALYAIVVILGFLATATGTWLSLGATGLISTAAVWLIVLLGYLTYHQWRHDLEPRQILRVFAGDFAVCIPSIVAGYLAFVLLPPVRDYFAWAGIFGLGVLVALDDIFDIGILVDVEEVAA